MKKIKLSIYCLLVYAVNLVAQQSNPSCPNGDLEYSNSTNWTQYLGVSQNPLNLNLFVAGNDANRQGVHCGAGSCSNFQATGFQSRPPMLVNGVDYYGGFTIPNQGTYCLRVGNNQGGTEADMMKYTFVVTQQNKHFKFRYATVLEDGGHPAGQQPAVGYYFVLGNKITPSVGSPLDMYLFSHTAKTISADVNNPFFKISPKASNVVYKDWQCVELDLSSIVGQQVSFMFWSKDCTHTEHFGYAYLDGLCTDWPATANFTLNQTDFCNNRNPLMMDASASTGEDRYYLEALETDAVGNTIPNGLFFGQWFYTQAPNNININQWLNSNNITLKCNTYYKIKLAVMNDCALWNEQNKIVHYTCPAIDAGPNVTLCCNTKAQPCITIGSAVNNPYICHWSSYPIGYNSTAAQAQVCPLNSTAYILEAVDAKGCRATDSIIVKFKSATPTISIKTADPSACIPCGREKVFYAEINNNDCQKEDDYFVKNYPGANSVNSTGWITFNLNNNSFTNPQQGGNTYTAPNVDGVVFAVYNNGCKMVWDTKLISKYYNTYIPFWTQVIAPNGFSPTNQDNFNDWFVLTEGGAHAKPYGAPAAYDATEFQLTIFDRWGTIIRIVDSFTYGTAQGCLYNGDIKWDGRNFNGNLVPNDTYNYILDLKRCNGQWENVYFSNAYFSNGGKWVGVLTLQ